MLAIDSRHARRRAQQRGIPPLISHWLLDFGEEEYTGTGRIIRYFSRGSIRSMERAFGTLPVKRMSEYLRCYLVESNTDGTIITVGKRHDNKHIWRH